MTLLLGYVKAAGAAGPGCNEQELLPYSSGIPRIARAETHVATGGATVQPRAGWLRAGL